MKPYRPARILVEEAVSENPVTMRVLASFPDIPVEWMGADGRPSPQHGRAGSSGDEAGDPITAGKRLLRIARSRGELLRTCPGSHGTVCCDYRVVNLIMNCHLECTYCFLQEYLNRPGITLLADVERLFDEVIEAERSTAGHTLRIGTGELSDSLALDSITGYSLELVPFFAERRKATLEFKTKTDQVENLLRLDPRGRVLISWSVNPQEIIEREELKTSGLEQRLSAARRVAHAGYAVAFHLDPIVHYDGWREGYRDLIERIVSAVPRDALRWISLGSLRMSPGLKPVMRRRFPRSRLLDGELLPTPRGKLRYLRPLRVEMYREIVEVARRLCPRIFLYLCMEEPGVWRRVFEWVPADIPDLESRFPEIGAGR